MDTLLAILMEPRILAIIGPLGLLCSIEGFVVVKLFNMYTSSMNTRLAESLTASQKLSDLVGSVCTKLDILISVWKNHHK